MLLTSRVMPARLVLTGTGGENQSMALPNVASVGSPLPVHGVDQVGQIISAFHRQTHGHEGSPLVRLPGEDIEHGACAIRLFPEIISLSGHARILSWGSHPSRGVAYGHAP